MKKLPLGLFIIFISISCNRNKPLSLPQVNLKPPTPLFSLNGIPLDKADKMISRFLTNRKIKDHETSVLFTYDVFHNIDLLLKAQNADGIRIYFAKTTLGKETIVMISTFDGGAIPNDAHVPQKHAHMDYYQRAQPYFNAINKNIVVSYGEPYGALLFANPNCPSDGNDGCDDTKPHYITCHKAYQMVQSFVKPDPANNPKDTINTTSEWFDRGIIDDLDSELHKTPGSGLRVYFAQCLKPDYDGLKRHGFVLITTDPAQNNNEQDNYTCFTIHPLYTSEKTEKVGGTHNPFFGGTDNGEQCPNNCYGVTWP